MSANAKWYVKNSGEVIGPLSDFEIADRLRTRKLEWLDFAIQSGERAWRPLIEIPGLRALVAAEPLAMDGQVGMNTDTHLENKLAIALTGWTVRIVRQGQPVRMAGPLATADISAALKAGAISFSDLAWRQGESSWSRIGDMTEFGALPKPKLAAVPALGAEASREELLSNVFKSGELNRRQSEKPEEASGEDLVAMPAWMKLLSIALAVGAVAVGSRASAAGKIEIVPLKLQSSTPALVFQTDAAISEPIAVDITGASGEILDLPSLERHISVTRAEGEVPTLSLAGQKLPTGHYTVTATVVQGAAVDKVPVTTSSKIFVGLNDEKFEAELALHVKAIAAQQQVEKKTLFYSSKEFSRLARQLAKVSKSTQGSGKSWSRFYERFQIDLAKTRASIDELSAQGELATAYPAQIASLRSAAERLKLIGESKQIGEPKLGREVANVAQARPTSVSPTLPVAARDLAHEFDQLKTSAGLLSSSSPR